MGVGASRTGAREQLISARDRQQSAASSFGAAEGRQIAPVPVSPDKVGKKARKKTTVAAIAAAASGNTLDAAGIATLSRDFRAPRLEDDQLSGTSLPSRRGSEPEILGNEPQMPVRAPKPVSAEELLHSLWEHLQTRKDLPRSMKTLQAASTILVVGLSAMLYYEYGKSTNSDFMHFAGVVGTNILGNWNMWEQFLKLAESRRLDRVFSKFSRNDFGTGSKIALVFLSTLSALPMVFAGDSSAKNDGPAYRWFVDGATLFSNTLLNFLPIDLLLRHPGYQTATRYALAVATLPTNLIRAGLTEPRIMELLFIKKRQKNRFNKLSTALADGIKKNSTRMVRGGFEWHNTTKDGEPLPCTDWFGFHKKLPRRTDLESAKAGLDLDFDKLKDSDEFNLSALIHLMQAAQPAELPSDHFLKGGGPKIRGYGIYQWMEKLVFLIGSTSGVYSSLGMFYSIPPGLADFGVDNFPGSDIVRYALTSLPVLVYSILSFHFSGNGLQHMFHSLVFAFTRERDYPLAIRLYPKLCSLLFIFGVGLAWHSPVGTRKLFDEFVSHRQEEIEIVGASTVLFNGVNVVQVLFETVATALARRWGSDDQKLLVNLVEMLDLFCAQIGQIKGEDLYVAIKNLTDDQRETLGIQALYKRLEPKIELDLIREALFENKITIEEIKNKVENWDALRTAQLQAAGEENIVPTIIEPEDIKASREFLYQFNLYRDPIGLLHERHTKTQLVKVHTHFWSTPVVERTAADARGSLGHYPPAEETAASHANGGGEPADAHTNGRSRFVQI